MLLITCIYQKGINLSELLRDTSSPCHQKIKVNGEYDVIQHVLKPTRYAGTINMGHTLL